MPENQNEDSIPLAPGIATFSLGEPSKGDDSNNAPTSSSAVNSDNENGPMIPDAIAPPDLNQAKKPKKSVSTYYKKQNELLENFQKDTEQIQVFRKTRFTSTCSDEPSNSNGNGTEVVDETAEPGAPLLRQLSGDNDLETCRNGSKKSLKKQRSDSLQEMIDKNQAAQKQSQSESRAAGRLSFVTLLINVSLMIAKAVASYLSGSMSILSSLADSVVDITTGLVIFGTSRMIRKRDPYLYPRGRTRLEPLALIVISTVMGIASVMLIYESVKRVITNDVKLDVDAVSAGIMVATICVKFTLMCVCRQYDDPSINVLAMDHRNDCLSNSVALVCAALASYFGPSEPLWWNVDPLGAIIVSIYIAYTWFSTGKEHTSMLSGKTADPDFINRIIKVALDHDNRVNGIDTVYVYHWGTKFLVEVHIILDPEMLLRDAHDISESLQVNIESLPEVERAFVHTDYESDHQPGDEHKVV